MEVTGQEWVTLQKAPAPEIFLPLARAPLEDVNILATKVDSWRHKEKEPAPKPVTFDSLEAIQESMKNYYAL